MTSRHVPVLIIGAGFAGLTAAALLAWRGIPCLLVEQRASINRHPRAHGVGLRSMESLRVIPGLEGDLRRASRAAPGDSTIMIAESVAGPVIKTLATPGDADWRALSPATPSSIGQDRVEPILLRHASALGANIRFSTQVGEFSQDADGVSVTLRDMRSGEETVWRADYLIVAEGAHSRARETLGIPMFGREALSHAVSILFKADLRAVAPARGFLLCYIRNPEFNGAFVTTDDPNVGQINVEYDPHRENASDYDEERCAKIVRVALGAPQLDVTVFDVLPWKMSSLVVSRMAQGRVFLAGDAAHIMPPVGGLAGQAAIQDAADLVWKLAMVIQGRAGRKLLDTYDAERRPVAQITAARLTANYGERLRIDRTDLPRLADDRMDNLSVAFGYRYRSSAIATEADDDLCAVEDPHHPTGRPGSRLAHIRLARDGEIISSLDLLGRDFLLLGAPGDGRWMVAAQALRRNFGAPLAAYQVGWRLSDYDGKFQENTGLALGGASLIRPDGFIAWRSRGPAADPLAALESALDRARCIGMVGEGLPA